MRVEIKLIRKIQIWLLKQEIKKAGNFFFGGYDFNMLYINNRYLRGWKIEQARKWLKEGKIIPSITREITSPATGRTYTDQLFKFKI